MTLKQVTEILGSKEALQCAAAEADGYERVTTRGPYITWGRNLETDCYKPTPYYLSFDTLYAAERRLGLHDRGNTKLRVKWVNTLHDLVETLPDTPKNKCGSPVVSDIDKLTASENLRCAAFIVTANWKKDKDAS